jgi:uncharacterized membrane protein YeiH
MALLGQTRLKGWLAALEWGDTTLWSVHVDALHVASLVGTFVFGVSGVLAAADRRLDVFGFALVGMATALGGGTIRSMIVDQRPPWMEDWVFLTVALVGSWATLIALRLLRPHRDRFVAGVGYADAAGLALFCITGTAVGVDLGYRGVVAVVLGVITAVGGGVIRDLLVGRVPFIMQSQIYATAAILGATIYVVLVNLDVDGVVAGVIGGVMAFVLRVVAMRRSWSLPAFGALDPPGGAKSST